MSRSVRLARRLAISLIGAVIGVDSGVAVATPLAEIKARYPESEALLLDRRNQPLHEFRIESTYRRLGWTELNNISAPLIELMVKAEDQRFYEHSGVDWQAAASASIENLTRPTQRGASTLTMQLAGLLDADLQPTAIRRTAQQKGQQTFAALKLEGQLTKPEILEAYLNVVTFRGEWQGVAAASRGLFGKAPGGVNRDEALLLAVLVRGPQARTSLVASRACALAKRLGEPARCVSVAALASRVLSAPSQVQAIAQVASANTNAAPHVAAWLKQRRAGQASTAIKGGSAIATTLDGALQRIVQESAQRHLAELNSRNVRHAAVLVLDNATGEVRAYVGAASVLARAPEVDGVQAKRQAGSTLKPFLYGLAIERQLLTSASPVDDSPTQFIDGAGRYAPKNYDHSYHGAVSVRQALAASLNIPAVKTLEVIGQPVLFERLKALGVHFSESADFYGHSLALGGADISLWELTHAYRALANGGRVTPQRLPDGTVLQALGTPATPSTSAVIDPKAAFIINDILADRGARSLTFGLDSVLASRSWAAVKTGTSKDMRDNWCMGITQQHTIGVWVGNFDGSPMRDVSGASGAAPIWADIVAHLATLQPSEPPRPPTGLVQASVRDIKSQQMVTDWFIAGTEPDAGSAPTQAVVARQDATANLGLGVKRVTQGMANAASAGPAIAARGNTARIIYPTEGLVVAFDPDIPAHAQGIFVALATSSSQTPSALGLVFNGQILRPNEHKLPVNRGKHALELVNAAGQVLQRVRFEVR